VTAERRDQILDAAASVIAHRGICATRVADIAKRLSISPALIMYYFPSKDALLGEALAFRDRQFFDHVASVPDGTTDPWKRLDLLIRASCPESAADRASGDEWDLWLDTWSRSRHDPDLAQHRARMDDLFRSTVSEIVRSGVAQGLFHHSDPDRFALTLTALIDGLAIQVLLGDSAVDTESMVEICVGLARRDLDLDA
jgi:AcrR family transcriptional regulator